MEEKARRFASELPGKFFLNAEDLSDLTRYLQSGGHLRLDDHVLSAVKPGEGNMNYVLRVQSHSESIILKQARPWVEKYPMIDAPIERICVEATYLEVVRNDRITSQHAPKLLWFDPDNLIMALEDLGAAADFLPLYQRDASISEDTLEILTTYLIHLHGLVIPASFPTNMQMRQLNHEHIFRFPFRSDNGMNLDDIQPGLAAEAVMYHDDTNLIAKTIALGEIYLGSGSALIHGDFYPGSWLETHNGLKVIDPEFGFYGPPEFDLGVMMAHMMMAQQPRVSLSFIWRTYCSQRTLDPGLLSKFTGVEILRRLIGIAQLPLSLSIGEKSRLMATASDWIIQENLVDGF